jgi:tetratricopeptide (TPR) repeat protein
MYGALDDRSGMARTAMGLARAHGDEAPDEAVRLAHRALSEYRMIGDRAGQANALNSVAWFGARAGRYAEALPFAEQALALQQQLDAGLGEGDAWDTLGYLRQATGDHAGAVAAYRAALAIFTAFGHRYFEADTLTHLGGALAAADPPAARIAWKKALAILDDLGHGDAEAVRRRLADSLRTP